MLREICEEEPESPAMKPGPYRPLQPDHVGFTQPQCLAVEGVGAASPSHPPPGLEKQYVITWLSCTESKLSSYYCLHKFSPLLIYPDYFWYQWFY